jgi:hypothetical protein
LYFHSSGPGGRRFKSSLSDHLFSLTYRPHAVEKPNTWIRPRGSSIPSRENTAFHPRSDGTDRCKGCKIDTVSPSLRLRSLIVVSPDEEKRSPDNSGLRGSASMQRFSTEWGQPAADCIRWRNTPEPHCNLLLMGLSIPGEDRSRLLPSGRRLVSPLLRGWSRLETVA